MKTKHVNFFKALEFLSSHPECFTAEEEVENPGSSAGGIGDDENWINDLMRESAQD
jgi:hypothetical protein